MALGSSFAAGSGLGPPDPKNAEGWSGATASAYPRLVADRLNLALVNAACGGAITDNVTTTRQEALDETGTRIVPLQIDAVDRDTDVVTITIGGNDVNYVGCLIAEAYLAADPESPTSIAISKFGDITPWSDDEVARALDGLEVKLAAVVSAVQREAPRARILLVDYLTILPEDGEPCRAIPIPRERQRFLRQVAQRLSLATERAARLTGAEFVAVSNESRRHHACSPEPWVTGYRIADGVAPMHPNEAGHVAVAAAVVRQLTGAGTGAGS
ncbi:SGNH/GDSL hydrolase family protein [Lysobacter korlensis]|uniref:SGNH/GDSL hydrolase family protein n=1 Tax=Lysobacter korlensis TaxID=553636 RepID=A0ABV6RX28_9GAMM